MSAESKRLILIVIAIQAIGGMWVGFCRFMQAVTTP